ncbi:MAG: hypothetical protein ACYDGY_10220 [Acidimicrobiales bacterium]
MIVIEDHAKFHGRRDNLVEGYGYEITAADVWSAYSNTMRAAVNCGSTAETQERVKKCVTSERPGGFVTKVLGGELGP